MTSTRVSTGIDGLDDVLDGGFVPERSYMVRGPPGAGKTLLGTHFLTADPDDDALFICLAETAADVRADAAAFGIDLADVAFLDLSPSPAFFTDDRSYDIFPSSEVEGESTTDRIADTVRDLEPDRVFVDPLTQFRYLAPDEYQFRKEVLSFLQFLTQSGATVVFTSQDTAAEPDDDLQFMSDGIVHLDADDRNRTLRVSKFRGSAFRDGEHAVAIGDDGMTVHPRVASNTTVPAAALDDQLSSGVPGVDALLGGGIERGTVTLLAGPSGVGKTTLGTQFCQHAAANGDRAYVYLFEESLETFLHRCSAIGMPVRDLVDEGSLVVERVDPLDTSPEAFAAKVKTAVEDGGATIVMVDGIEGYELATRGGDEAAVRERLHALGNYCKSQGATAILTSEMDSVTGHFTVSGRSISYLADTAVFLRYIEFEGELRKAIGVLKKRTGEFEHTLREFGIDADGVTVGDPLTGLRGILQGTPEWTDRAAQEGDD